MYDASKKAKRTLDLIEPIIAASWLNRAGDIVAALDSTLVLIRADAYQYLTQDEVTVLIAEHTKAIHPGLPQPKGPQTHTHTALQRQPTLHQQLSKIPAELADDFLSQLLTLGPNARLSIFDVPPSRPEVCEAAVIAKVATAVKVFQRYKSPTVSPTPPLLNVTAADDSKARPSTPEQTGRALATTSAIADQAEHSTAARKGLADCAEHDDSGIGKGHASGRPIAEPSLSGHGGRLKGAEGSPGSKGSSRAADQPGPRRTGVVHEAGNVNMHVATLSRYCHTHCQLVVCMLFGCYLPSGRSQSLDMTPAPNDRP